MRIEDGEGKGVFAGVDNEKRLKTTAVTQTLDEHINQTSGKVWSLPFENLSPTGTDDYVIYIKNTGEKTLSVSDIRMSAETAATQIVIQGVTGTAAGGSDVTPVSRTLGSDATITGVTQTGANITGLTTSGTIFYMQLDTVGVEKHLRTTSKIRIPKGTALAIQVAAATASITGEVSIVEEE